MATLVDAHAEANGTRYHAKKILLRDLPTNLSFQNEPITSNEIFDLDAFPRGY